MISSEPIIGARRGNPILGPYPNHFGYIYYFYNNNKFRTWITVSPLLELIKLFWLFYFSFRFFTTADELLEKFMIISNKKYLGNYHNNY